MTTFRCTNKRRARHWELVYCDSSFLQQQASTDAEKYCFSHYFIVFVL